MLDDELFHGKKSEKSEPRKIDDPQEKDPKNQPEVSEEEEYRIGHGSRPTKRFTKQR